MDRLATYPFTIYAAKGENSGLVKLGITYDVKTRLQSLRASAQEPVTLLLTVQAVCPKAGERYLLKRFAASRVEGRGKEWFRLSESELASLPGEFDGAAGLTDELECRSIEILRQVESSTKSKEKLIISLHSASAWQNRFQAMLDDMGIPLVVRVEPLPVSKIGKDT